jgi:pullulanase/glycogen debranching enzyme
VTCHDGFTLNDLVSWNLLDRYGDIHRFVQQMIRLRLSLNVFREDHGLSLNQLLQTAQIDLHGTRPNQPDWSDHSRRFKFLTPCCKALKLGGMQREAR